MVRLVAKQKETTMDDRMFWLMGLCVIFLLIGVWLGWESWGKKPAVQRQPTRPLTDAELWQSDPQNPAN